MAGKRIDLVPIDEQLHGGDRRQVVGQGVHEAVHRKDLVERPTAMCTAGFDTEVHECDALRTEIEALQSRAGREHRHGWWRWRLQQRHRQLASLFERAVSEWDFGVHRLETEAVLRE